MKKVLILLAMSLILLALSSPEMASHTDDGSVEVDEQINKDHSPLLLPSVSHEASMIDESSGEVFSLRVLEPKSMVYEEGAVIEPILAFEVPGDWLLCVTRDAAAAADALSDAAAAADALNIGYDVNLGSKLLPLIECDIPGRRPVVRVFTAALQPGEHIFAAWMHRPPHFTNKDGVILPSSHDSERLLYVQVTYSTILKPNIEHAKLPSCYVRGGESEWGERALAKKHTHKCERVLELGGGAGSVSAIIQQELRDPRKHVVVQPDERLVMMGGFEQLLENKRSCAFHFTAIDHILTPTDVPLILETLGGLPDCLIADCESCLQGEFKRLPELFSDLKQFQVERDDANGNYDELFDRLGMVKVDEFYGCNGKCPADVWEIPFFSEVYRGA